MREKFKKLPCALRKQIASQVVLGVVLAIFGLILSQNILLCLPGLMAGGVLLVSGTGLFLRAIASDYLCLHGVCVEIEKHRRILIDVEGKRIQILVGKPIKGLRVDDAVNLYLLPDTPLYEQDGLYRLSTCIALERESD
ncbi:hypothetical protein [Acutalibacter sp. JLR.KK004]|uniref:hypothetical protein n=1 Tax=Acutalibacter sp. JLR.KK004 TaxID=3112622 RepID=UPI002FF29B82